MRSLLQAIVARVIFGPNTGLVSDITHVRAGINFDLIPLKGRIPYNNMGCHSFPGVDCDSPGRYLMCYGRKGTVLAARSGLSCRACALATRIVVLLALVVVWVALDSRTFVRRTRKSFSMSVSGAGPQLRLQRSFGLILIAVQERAVFRWRVLIISCNMKGCLFGSMNSFPSVSLIFLLSSNHGGVIHSTI